MCSYETCAECFQTVLLITQAAMAQGGKLPERTVGRGEEAVLDRPPRNTQGAVSSPKPRPTPHPLPYRPATDALGDQEQPFRGECEECQILTKPQMQKEKTTVNFMEVRRIEREQVGESKQAQEKVVCFHVLCAFLMEIIQCIWLARLLPYPPHWLAVCSCLPQSTISQQ